MTDVIRERSRGEQDSSEQRTRQETIHVQPHQQSPELTKWQLDSSDTFERLMKYLQGYAWNKDRGSWERVAPAKINKAGIHAIRQILYTEGSKNTALSDLSAGDVEKRLWKDQVALARHLYVNRDAYEIDTRRDIGYIIRNVMNVIQSAVKRSERGGERRFLSNTERRLTKTDVSSQDESGGLFSFLKRD